MRALCGTEDKDAMTLTLTLGLFKKIFNLAYLSHN